MNLAEIRAKGEELMKTDAKAARLFLCKNDLRYLCVEYLGYRDWDLIHDNVVNFMRGSDKKYKLMLLPRGHLKSSIVTIGWVIHRILIKSAKYIPLCSKLGQCEEFPASDKAVHVRV